jgi:hypothetical protein
MDQNKFASVKENNCKCNFCKDTKGVKATPNQLKGLKIGWKKKQNEKNLMWKGDKVGLPALHNWIRRRKLKPMFCVSCNENEPYDLANISGEYRRDINDFEWLCRSCHMRKDGRIEELIKKSKKLIRLSRSVLIIKICPICNKEYIITPKLIKINKFCSRKCTDKFKSLNKIFYGNQFILKK